MNHHLRQYAFFLAALVLFSSPAQGAEIELKAEAQASGGMVRLADVATIHTAGEAERQALADLELVPAPSPARVRMLKIREVQDLLALQGVKLVEHRFSGAAAVRIAAADAGLATPAAGRVSRSVAAQAEARVTRSIVGHLEQHAGGKAAWQVSLELSPQQVELVSARLADVQVEGGRAPWVGSQQFVLTVATPQGASKIPVQAEVSLPEMIVAAKRPLRRGEILTAADLELQLPSGAGSSEAPLTRLEDALGRETLRSVATGQSLEAAWLRKPLMVRRGDVVTVFARAANVRVRTQARAMDDGGQGEIVSVERLDNRQRFTARVVGVQELEVFVSSVSVSN